MEHEAATLIQKVWRGYKTRQILRYCYEEQPFDLNQLSESQVEELVRLGYLQDAEEESPQLQE